MASSADRFLLRESIRHQLDLVRYGNRVGRDAAAALAAGDDELLAYVAKRSRQLSRLPTVAAREQFTKAAASIERVNAAAYAAAHESMASALDKLAHVEAEFQAKMLSKALGRTVDRELARRVAESVAAAPIVGRTVEQQFADAAAARGRKIVAAVGDMVSGGGKWQDAVARVEGTEEEAFKDGFLVRAGEWMRTLARTDVAAVADAAGRHVYEDSGVVEMELWVSVLDSNTTEVCMANDGATRALGDADWSNGYSGPYPAHYGERSVIVPQSGKEPADKVTYDEWLADQSEEQQREILGDARYELFSAGRLPLDRFVDETGRPLTIDELRAREPAAVDRAGI